MQPTRLTRSFLVKKQFRHEESSVAWIIPSWIRQRIHGFWLPFASCSTGSRFVVDEFFFLIYLFLPSSLFAGNSTKNFERKIIFIKRRVKFCLTFSISKFDISTIKKILVFSLPWNGWDFFLKIVNPKFLRAQRTFPFANSSHQLAMQISNDEERIELRNPTSTRSTFSKPLSSSRVEDCATAFLVSFSLPNPHCISKERAAGEFSPLE